MQVYETDIFQGFMAFLIAAVCSFHHLESATCFVDLSVNHDRIRYTPVGHLVMIECVAAMVFLNRNFDRFVGSACLIHLCAKSAVPGMWWHIVSSDSL